MVVPGAEDEAAGRTSQGLRRSAWPSTAGDAEDAGIGAATLRWTESRRRPATCMPTRSGFRGAGAESFDGGDAGTEISSTRTNNITARRPISPTVRKLAHGTTSTRPGHAGQRSLDGVVRAAEREPSATASNFERTRTTQRRRSAATRSSGHPWENIHLSAPLRHGPCWSSRARRAGGGQADDDGGHRPPASSSASVVAGHERVERVVDAAGKVSSRAASPSSRSTCAPSRSASIELLFERIHADDLARPCNAGTLDDNRHHAARAHDEHRRALLHARRNSTASTPVRPAQPSSAASSSGTSPPSGSATCSETTRLSESAPVAVPAIQRLTVELQASLAASATSHPRPP